VDEFNRVDTAERQKVDTLKALDNCQHPGWRDGEWCVVCGALMERAAF